MSDKNVHCAGCGRPIRFAHAKRGDVCLVCLLSTRPLPEPERPRATCAHTAKPEKALGLCSACYGLYAKCRLTTTADHIRSLPDATCHPGRPAYAQGKCMQCYQREQARGRVHLSRRGLTTVCACPHIDRKHYAKGKCKSCYQASRSNRSPKVKAEVTCGHTERQHYAKGLCQSCYKRSRLEARSRAERLTYPPDVAEVAMRPDGSSTVRILDMARFVALTPTSTSKSEAT